MSTDLKRSDQPSNPVPRFEELRTELLALIERLSSGTWTDYNTHDPGITLGEHFAWGTTEDVYTAHHPMRDLLTLPEGEIPPPHPDFAAELVLPSRASTLLDYRKLLIDVPGVRNVWLRETNDPQAKLWYDPKKKVLTHESPASSDVSEVVLRGFYHVDVCFEEDVTEESIPDRLAALRRILEANRNLGEVFLNVVAARPEEIAVCTDIVVSPDAAIADVMPRIAAALEEFIAPAPRFQSLTERLAAGFSTDEILEGPLLVHGFLDNQEMLEARRPIDVRASDLIQVIMDVPGVVAVSRIVMTSFRDGFPSGETQPWVLPLDPARAPELSLARSCFTFFKRNLPFQITELEYARQLDALRAERRFRRYPAGTQTWPVAAGRRRALDEFPSLLNLLPLNYGVGQAGLPDDASTERRAQAKQLKAYFLLAERLLAGHRAQVARLRDVLSLRREAAVVKAAVPSDLRDFSTLLEMPESEFHKRHQEITESTEMRLEYRQRLADHFLARFGEPFDSLTVATSRRPSGDSPASYYDSKARWIASLPALARDRAAAVNLALPPAGPEQAGAISGLEAKLLNLLGASRLLPANALIITENSTGVDFALRDPGTARDWIISTQRFGTRSEAEATADAVVRAAPLPKRYRVQPIEGGFRFVMLDDCGEVLAQSSDTFTGVAEAEAATVACQAFFSSLPSNPPLFLLEHIHLRPLHLGAELLPACECAEDDPTGCFGDDPYAFRATLVLPAWPRRFHSLYYRAHLETIARELTPAHIFLKICWLDEAQMNAFSKVLLAWRRAHADVPGSIRSDPAAERDALVRVWRDLRSIFPVATLHNGVDGIESNPVVLDNNTLGTLEEAEP